MRNRQILLAVAVAAALFGLALPFVPGIDASLSVPDSLPAVLGASAVCLGLVRAWRWIRQDSTGSELPVIEGGHPVPVPGDDVDESLARIPSTSSVAGDRRAIGFRADLHDLAIDVLMEYRALSESEAEASLAAGEWTDDPVAAEFFSTVDGTGTSVTEAVAGTFWAEGPFHRRARRATAALGTIVESGGTE